MVIVLSTVGCQNNPFQKTPETRVLPLKEVPSNRLNYRFEPDVPAPTADNKIPMQSDERNEAVQLDFDNNRISEILDRTITSPNKQRVVAIYRKPDDDVTEYRLDMYGVDGKLLGQITHEEMAVHFPDTIRWSPDSANVAFVAMVRGLKEDIAEKDTDKKEEKPTPTPEAEIVDKDDDEEKQKEELSEENTNTNTNTETPATPTPEPPKEVITFRTEQVYMSNADGKDVKPLTQREGLIHFFFAWSPDSSALAVLGATITEWRIMEARMKNAGKIFVPIGRPKVVEKSGRERLLDDNLTTAHPVWSPDSAKIAVAFNKQVRIYDALGEQPTQAAILLNNDLLLASKDYEEKQKAAGNEIVSDSNTNANANANTKSNANVQNTPETKTTLPDASSLATFQPIINLDWNQETLLYLQTGYLGLFNDPTENVSSHLRWHRLVLSPQPINTNANK